MVVLSHGNSYVAHLSNLLYKYCIGDERNALIEQFYKEVENKDPNTSQIYINLKNDLRHIRLNKNDIHIYFLHDTIK